MLNVKSLDLKKLNEAAKMKRREPNNKPLGLAVSESQFCRFRMLQDRFKLRKDLEIDMQDIMRRLLDVGMDKAEKLLDHGHG